MLGETEAGVHIVRFANLAVEHGDERGRKRTLGEKRSEHVGQAEGDEKGVGGETCADVARLKRVANEREDSADQREPADRTQRTGEVHSICAAPASGVGGRVRRRLLASAVAALDALRLLPL